jgi:hypothetical protein
MTPLSRRAEPHTTGWIWLAMVPRRRTSRSFSAETSPPAKNASAISSSRSARASTI